MCKWKENDGVITFSVTTDGESFKGWVVRLERGGFRVGDRCRQLFLSTDIQPTNGVTTQISVLKGTSFDDDDRTTSVILAKAKKKNLVIPSIEVACLIREMFSDDELKEMGLWFMVVMHESVDVSDCPSKLAVDRSGSGRWIEACDISPSRSFGDRSGFAFAAS